MINFFVNEEGSLTAAGYGIMIAIGIIVLLIASYIAGNSSKNKISAKQLAFCSLSITIAFVMSYIKFLPMPFGGSLTLCSMLFVVLPAYWYGVVPGVLVGFVYGILQFIQEPYILSLFQVCCDYLFAFSALGLAGLFINRKYGLIIGYIVGIIARGAFHTLGGYLFWMDYMPKSFPKAMAAIYPICYNYSFILGEGILTIIILSIPAVRNAIDRISAMAGNEAGKAD